MFLDTNIAYETSCALPTVRPLLNMHLSKISFAAPRDMTSKPHKKY